MPRANRFQQPGMICHLTHRCHDGQFLLKFARDRSEHRERLRQAAKEFSVSILNYCSTSNHNHQIAIESMPDGISLMMQKVEGEFAISFNRRKHRSGAFWGDRYHCTMIEDGGHLWNCIRYIDLNMVRANVVSHPSEWEWCGYRELVGERLRYRLLDMDRLLELLGVPDVRSFRKEYIDRIQSAIAGRRLNREKRWTESIAVGGIDFINNIAAKIRAERLRYQIESDEDGSFTLWDPQGKYGQMK